MAASAPAPEEQTPGGLGPGTADSMQHKEQQAKELELTDLEARRRGLWGNRRRKAGFVTGRKEEQSEGRIWRWWQEGGTYLDDIESREHAPMGLAALGN